MVCAIHHGPCKKKKKKKKKNYLNLRQGRIFALLGHAGQLVHQLCKTHDMIYMT